MFVVTAYDTAHTPCPVVVPCGTDAAVQLPKQLWDAACSVCTPPLFAALLPQCGITSDAHGAGPAGWAAVPTVMDMGSGKYSSHPCSMVYDFMVPACLGLTTASWWLRRPAPAASPASAAAALAVYKTSDGAVAVPYWATRTVAFWNTVGRFSTLPAYAKWDPAVPGLVMCDPWTYSGVDEKAVESVLWAAPFTAQHLVANAVTALVHAVSRQKPKALISTLAIVVGAGGCVQAASSATFTQVFCPASVAANSRVYMDRVWPPGCGTAAAVCSDACIGAVAVALNAARKRLPKVYMLDVLVGLHCRSARRRAACLWTQACRKAETLPGVVLGEEHLMRHGLDDLHHGVTTFVQLASAGGGVDGGTAGGAGEPVSAGKDAGIVRHYVLLQYVVRDVDRVVLYVLYSDPFWNDGHVSMPGFWDRMLQETACRGWVVTADTVLENRHVLLHRQAQDLPATCNACGWLCLQGAARVLLGAAPDVVHWRAIRAGLLSAVVDLLP